MIDLEKDGIDHINVYAMGRTEFGRFFSNMAETPIDLPYLGKFRCVEGLWHYLKFKDPRHRTYNGFDSKKLDNEYDKNPEERLQQNIPEDVFKLIIRQAVRQKARKHDGIVLCRDPRFKDLPLKHYMVYGKDHPTPKILDVTEKYKWWLDIIEEIRTQANV